jgi:heterodisulfide reductase subunit C
MTDSQLDSLLMACTRCGACRDVCIVEKLGAHSITSFLCGEDDYSPWLCSSCWLCQEVCPSAVDIHAVMMAQRREQRAPPGHRENFVNVLRSGYALAVDESVNEVRRFHGLEEVHFIPIQWLETLLDAPEYRESGEQYATRLPRAE